MYYIIYKTTNIVTNKFYIGAHKTDDLADGYLGSGLYIKRAIEKYGCDQFVREILEMCTSEQEMYDREREIVNEALLQHPDTYNLAVGGHGGPKKNSWARIDPEAQRAHARRAAQQSLAVRHLRDDTYRTRISESLKAHFRTHGSPNVGKVRERVACPYCGKEGAANTMKRWHFDNCKKL